MKAIFPVFMVILWLFSCDQANNEPESQGQLYINEFLASNDSSIADAFGDFDDWVELYNGTQEAIDLGGLYISDDPLDPAPWHIPASDPAVTTVAADDFIVLWCDEDIDQGLLHVDIKLSANGESIVIWAQDGTTIVDSLSFRPQISDVSWGRSSDGGAYWQSFSTPTPGASNTP